MSSTYLLLQYSIRQPRTHIFPFDSNELTKLIIHSRPPNLHRRDSPQFRPIVTSLLDIYETIKRQSYIIEKDLLDHTPAVKLTVLPQHNADT